MGLSMSVFLGRLGVPHLLVERHASDLAPPARPRQQPADHGAVPRRRNGARHPPGRVRPARQPRHPAGATRSTGSEQEWLFRQIDPGGGRPASARRAGACAARTTWNRCCCGTPRRSAARSASAPSWSPSNRTTTASRPNCWTVPPDAAAPVRADYLVAADGPRSPVREQLGITQSGRGDLFHNISVTFRAEQLADVVGDRRFIACYLTHPQGAGALLPGGQPRALGLPRCRGTPTAARRSRTSPTSGARRTSVRPPASPNCRSRSPAGRRGTRPSASPTGTTTAGSSSPATQRTKCRPPARSAPTPGSRTRTTSPGSSPRCCPAGRVPGCWRPTGPSAAR